MKDCMDWHVESYGPYGGQPEVAQVLTRMTLDWKPEGGNQRAAQQVAEEFAAETSLDELIDHNDRLTTATLRLVIRPRELPDASTERVMVDVRLRVHADARDKFSEREWCEE